MGQVAQGVSQLTKIEIGQFQATARSSLPNTNNDPKVILKCLFLDFICINVMLKGFKLTSFLTQ